MDVPPSTVDTTFDKPKGSHETSAKSISKVNSKVHVKLSLHSVKLKCGPNSPETIDCLVVNEGAIAGIAIDNGPGDLPNYGSCTPRDIDDHTAAGIVNLPHGI